MKEREATNKAPEEKQVASREEEKRQNAETELSDDELEGVAGGIIDIPITPKDLR